MRYKIPHAVNRYEILLKADWKAERVVPFPAPVPKYGLELDHIWSYHILKTILMFEQWRTIGPLHSIAVYPSNPQYTSSWDCIYLPPEKPAMSPVYTVHPQGGSGTTGRRTTQLTMLLNPLSVPRRELLVTLVGTQLPDENSHGTSKVLGVR